MRKKFSILDLIDIFIEKILVLLGLIILSILFSWYYLSNQIPKYLLHHKTFHIEYFEDKNLMDLSQLKFYTKGIHLQQLKSDDLEIINLEKNISYINYYLTKQEGVINNFLRLIDVNKSNKLDFFKNDEYIEYVFKNTGYNYISSERSLNLYLDFSTKDKTKIIEYKKSLINYINFIHTELKKEFIGYFTNLLKIHEKNLEDEIKYLNDLIINYQNSEFDGKNNFDNFVQKAKFLKSNLETINSYTINSKKIIENLKINLDFNLLNINFDTEYINVKEESANVFLVYLISSIIMFMLYVIYVLILLGYRNR